MRSRVAIASVISLLLLVAYVRAQQFGSQPAKLNIVKVKDDLFVIRNDFVPGNTTALVTNEGVVLVDDKFEQDAPNILSLLKTVTNQPVKYVVNTHHHGDHSGGNARMQMAGAQLIASEQARRYMVDAKQTGQPGVTFVDRALIHLGGKTVELYHVPGAPHSNGLLIAYFPRERILFQGDFSVNPAQGGGVQPANDHVRALVPALAKLGIDYERYINVHASAAPQTKADVTAAMSQPRP